MARSCSHLAVLPVFWLALSGFGGPAHEGAVLHGKGDYQGALEEYKKSQGENPDNLSLDYNMGGAYHMLGEYQEAVKAYERAAKETDPAVGKNALFNRGVSLYRAGEAEEKKGDIGQAQKLYSAGAEGYKAILRSDRDDKDARHNLELLLAKIQQMEDKKRERSQTPNQKGEGDNEKKDSSQGEDKQPSDKDKQDQKSANQPQEDKAADEQERKPQEKQAYEKPGQMTPEQAKMALDAIDKEEKNIKKSVREKMIPPSRRPEKDW